MFNHCRLLISGYFLFKSAVSLLIISSMNFILLAPAGLISRQMNLSCAELVCPLELCMVTVPQKRHQTGASARPIQRLGIHVVPWMSSR